MLRAEPQAVNYQVLRPFDGHEPGEVIEAKDWPFGRARQLTEQRYLLPLASAAAEMRPKTAGGKTNG